jgi:MoaA/NifB/PqqE/SkfB family radical SAM enzyme
MECDFCPHLVMGRPKKHMSYDFFKNIIDQIVQGNLTKHIELAAIGESLLHPRLFDAIRYCTEKGLHASMVTNSLALTTEKYQKLADSGLKQLLINLQNLTEDSFKYRHSKSNKKFESFYDNVLDLVDYHISHDIPIDMDIALMFCKPNWISGELWDLPALKESTENASTLLRKFLDDMNEIAKKNNVAAT